MVTFTLEHKIRAVAAFIGTMHDTAGCDADELKQLFQPAIIDEVVKICKDKQEARNVAIQKLAARRSEAATGADGQGR